MWRALVAIGAALVAALALAPAALAGRWVAGDLHVHTCYSHDVWCPPNERHWHGATPTTAMTHIAIQEALDGKVVEWMEKVSDEQYRVGK